MWSFSFFSLSAFFSSLAGFFASLHERLAKATVLPANKLTKPSSLFSVSLTGYDSNVERNVCGWQVPRELYQHPISTTTLTPLDKNCGEVTRVVI